MAIETQMFSPDLKSTSKYFIGSFFAAAPPTGFKFCCLNGWLKELHSPSERCQLTDVGSTYF